MSRCIGCGAKLQSTDSKLSGYIPTSIIVEHGDEVYCQRCHNIKYHNSDYSKETYLLMSDSKILKSKVNEYYQKLAFLKTKQALILLMIDIMDIYGGFIPDLYKYIGNNPVIVLVNKTDVIPKDIKIRKLTETIEQIARNDNLNLREIVYISAIKPRTCDAIITRLMAIFNRKSHPYTEVYVLGATSVGKSTFINEILKQYGDAPGDIITTSDQHQTTLDVIKIPIGTNRFHDECYLYDTPGFINLSNIGTYLSYESIKKLALNSFIKPRTYQLNGSQSIFLGGLVRIDFQNETNVSFFVSNDLYLHRTKMENANNLWDSKRFELLVPPFSSEEANRLGAYEVKNYKLPFNEKFLSWDICIAGIGYIHIRKLEEEFININIYCPTNVLISITPNLW